MPGVQKPHCRPCSFQEGFLYGVKLAVGLHGEHRAFDRLAVHRDRAYAANGRLAADVRAGEAGHPPAGGESGASAAPLRRGRACRNACPGARGLCRPQYCARRFGLSRCTLAGSGCNSGYNSPVRAAKTLRLLLAGTSDAPIHFDDLCSLVGQPGFRETRERQPSSFS